MGKTKGFFDFMTVLTIFLVSMAVSSFLNSQKGEASMGVMVLAVLIAAIYSLMIILLGIRKSKKISHGISIVIGSIFVPILLPIIYYLTYLRALIGVSVVKE
jgi:hypothetical protein